MKILKLSLLAMIMAFVMMACSDDGVTDPTDETNNIPDTKLTIIATFDDGRSDTTIITKSLNTNSFKPDSFSVSSIFHSQLNYIVFNIVNRDTLTPRFSFYVAFPADTLAAGIYNADKSGATYSNGNLSDLPYFIVSGPMTITKINEISEDGIRTYYCDGSMDLIYDSPKAIPDEISVEVRFEGLPFLINEDEY